MFWLLNGATRKPVRDHARQSPVTSSDFPASELVPVTSSAPTGASVRRPESMLTNVRAMSSVHVHLVRHGQSEWNVIGRLQGQTAHPELTTLGREQAQHAATELVRRVKQPAALWSSDLARAVQTARIIGEHLGLPVQLDAALREQALGSIEGTLTSMLRAQEPPPGVHVGDVRWGGGESTADVYERVGGFLGRELPSAPAHVILVSHGDTIRTARAWLQQRSHRDLEWDVIGNGAVITIAVNGTVVPRSGRQGQPAPGGAAWTSERDQHRR